MANADLNEAVVHKHEWLKFEQLELEITPMLDHSAHPIYREVKKTYYKCECGKQVSLDGC